jgi:APA family basic amino acid/polyamine antiporter
MARDGLFFKKLGEVHPRFHTPAFAIITGSIWSAILACIGTFQQLLSYVVFTGWIFYALAAACVFVYRKRMHGGMPPYQVPGYPWTPLLFILSAGALVGNTIIAKPGDAVKGLAMMLLGVPVYLFWRAKSREGGPPEEAVPAGELQE